MDNYDYFCQQAISKVIIIIHSPFSILNSKDQLLGGKRRPFTFQNIPFCNPKHDLLQSIDSQHVTQEAANSLENRPETRRKGLPHGTQFT